MGTASLAANKPRANAPFIVGVSGHRDLNPEGVAHVRAAVTAFVHELKRHLPDTELRVIVGMAEGADLLVAQTALELGRAASRRCCRCRWSTTRRISTPRRWRCCGSLLRARTCAVRRAAVAGAMHDAAAVGTPLHRDALYANLTETLIRRSSLLLALWDGQSSPLPGGTADTVLRFLGVRTDANVHDRPHRLRRGPPTTIGHDERLVYWIPAARSSGAPSRADGASRASCAASATTRC